MNQNLAGLDARVERERAAHEEDDVLARNEEIKSRFPHIGSYPSLRRLHGRVEEIARGAKGGRTLDYGCGRGDMSLKYLEWGLDVVGIDIASNYVEDAAARARAAGFAEDRFDFRVMDAHKLGLAADSFDLVIGFGILHHLDTTIAMQEIHRVLRPGGTVLLQEPLLDNPLLRLFRALTPSARTEDELPLSGKALKSISTAQAWTPAMTYSGLISLPAAMVTSLLFPRRPENALLLMADRIEQWMHRHHVLDPWNQYVLICLTKDVAVPMPGD